MGKMKRKKRTKKRGKYEYNIPTYNQLKKKFHSSLDIVFNGNETLIPPHKKQSKGANQSTNVSDSVLVWVCRNRQLDQRREIHLELSPCLKALIEEIYEYFEEITEEMTLAILGEDDTWSEICVNDVDIPLIDIGIQHNSTISIEQKKRVSMISLFSSKSTEKTYLTVKHMSLNRDIQIEFDENATFAMLKERIRSQFGSDCNIECLQLNINSTQITIPDDNSPSSPTSASAISESEPTEKLVKSNGHYGLRNLGNTCYMNSALQSLSNVEFLTDYFLNKESVQGEITQAYYNFIQNVWKDGRVYNPIPMKKCINSQASEFDNFEQHDAHEFMIFLLNQLHDDLQEDEQTGSIISQLFSCQMESRTTCLTCKKIRTTTNVMHFLPLSLDNEKKRRIFKISFATVELSVETNANGCIEDLVFGFLVELEKQQTYPTEDLFEHLKVTSTSTNEELSFDTSLNQILDPELIFTIEDEILRKSKKQENHPMELIDCFNEFIALETPSNPWFCKMDCNKPVHTAKQMLLSILPPVLIIQLKRFTETNGDMRKLNTFVKFPIERLDLTKFIINQEETALYDLIAVVNHMGDLDHGHYTTYARQLSEPSKQWFCFNDDEVTPIDESEVVSTSAYILTYVRR